MEIKISKDDLFSGNSLSFYGDYNYLVISEKLHEYIEDVSLFLEEYSVNKEIGIIVYHPNNDIHKFEAIKDASFADIGDSERIYLMGQLNQRLYAATDYISSWKELTVDYFSSLFREEKGIDPLKKDIYPFISYKLWKEYQCNGYMFLLYAPLVTRYEIENNINFSLPDLWDSISDFYDINPVQIILALPDKPATCFMEFLYSFMFNTPFTFYYERISQQNKKEILECSIQEYIDPTARKNDKDYRYSYKCRVLKHYLPEIPTEINHGLQKRFAPQLISDTQA